jgi:hypothetical protein
MHQSVASSAACAVLRQSIGGEHDEPSRQLARYVKEVGENSATQIHVRLVWRRDPRSPGPPWSS